MRLANETDELTRRLRSRIDFLEHSKSELQQQLVDEKRFVFTICYGAIRSPRSEVNSVDFTVVHFAVEVLSLFGFELSSHVIIER
jgi:hypothetical protein